MPRVLFVCLGNICRSPSAEAVARRIAPALAVDSAGTGDWHLGKPPYGPAIRAGAARGYDLTPLRARQVRKEDFDAFDLILAMDGQNLADLRRLRPAGARARLARLLDFAPETGRRDVPDPYFTGDFGDALDLIEAGVLGLAAALEDGDTRALLLGGNTSG